MKHLVLAVLLLLSVLDQCTGQNADSVYTSSLSKPRPITVVTSDARTYKGMVLDITTDYVLIDLHLNKSVMVNTPYYLRPAGKYYRIDVEYIKLISTKKPKRVLKSALFGGLGGMVAFGTANMINEDAPNEFFVASAVGLVVGSIVGTITGLVTHKKWEINGSSVALAAFRDHYF